MRGGGSLLWYRPFDHDLVLERLPALQTPRVEKDGLSTLSVNPPRKQRMSFRQRSVTYVKSFLRAFTREKRYPTCFKFRFVSSPHIDPASMIVVDLAGEKLQDAFCGFRRGCQFSLMMRIAAGVSG